MLKVVLGTGIANYERGRPCWSTASIRLSASTERIQNFD